MSAKDEARKRLWRTMKGLSRWKSTASEDGVKFNQRGWKEAARCLNPALRPKIAPTAKGSVRCGRRLVFFIFILPGVGIA